MRATKTDLVLCLKNKGYEVSLERRKIYRAIPDRAAALDDLVRVIDESGEDYLYPADFFASVKLPQALRRAVLAAV
ncbi:MAG TPA: hypothetical protein VJL28_09800 [Gemmatimonadaceae bacterium]|nr:hypothetical protein [Gemmatimonadaceae bacterium]